MERREEIKQKLDKNSKTKRGKGVTRFLGSAVLSGVRGDRRSMETGISSKRGFLITSRITSSEDIQQQTKLNGKHRTYKGTETQVKRLNDD